MMKIILSRLHVMHDGMIKLKIRQHHKTSKVRRNQMTSNQLAYWRDQETKRSNIANETETHRFNVARETETKRHNIATLNETIRHNTATESIGWDSNRIQEKVAQETARSNRAKEVETSRHNQVLEALQESSNRETARHNLEYEGIVSTNNILTLAESRRSHKSGEQIQRDKLEIDRVSAEAKERASWGQFLSGAANAAKFVWNDLVRGGAFNWYVD